jgi:uncharacterized membrane protein
MSNKTLSILSYVTIIGWIIAFVKHKEPQQKNALVSYHLKQGFGLFIVSLLFNVAMTVVAMVVPALSFVGTVGSILTLILIIIGIINAANEQEKPLPLIGGLFEKKFSFIP